MGNPEAGLRVMCNNAMAAKALGDKVCPVAVQPLPADNKAAYSVNVNPNSTEK